MTQSVLFFYRLFVVYSTSLLRHSCMFLAENQRLHMDSR